jgi:hypothetical protein
MGWRNRGIRNRRRGRRMVRGRVKRRRIRKRRRKKMCLVNSETTKSMNHGSLQKVILIC